MAAQLLPDLQRMAFHPSVREKSEEVDGQARTALEYLSGSNKMSTQPSIVDLRQAVLDACYATYVPVIERRRLHVLLMPAEWVRDHIVAVAMDVLDPNDDWAYRRLLELLSMAAPELVPNIVSQGLLSTNCDIREAAEDFDSCEVVASTGRDFTQSLAERNERLRLHLETPNRGA